MNTIAHRLTATLAVLVTLVSALLVTAEARAQEADPLTCSILVIHPHSKVAQRCRDKGWVIHEHLLINRNGNAWTDLPPCKTEDGRRCYWNARTMGNGEGRSFVQLGKKGTFFYLKTINGVRSWDAEWMPRR